MARGEGRGLRYKHLAMLRSNRNCCLFIGIFMSDYIGFVVTIIRVACSRPATAIQIERPMCFFVFVLRRAVDVCRSISNVVILIWWSITTAKPCSTKYAQCTCDHRSSCVHGLLSVVSADIVAILGRPLTETSNIFVLFAREMRRGSQSMYCSWVRIWQFSEQEIMLIGS